MVHYVYVYVQKWSFLSDDNRKKRKICRKTIVGWVFPHLVWVPTSIQSHLCVSVFLFIPPYFINQNNNITLFHHTLFSFYFVKKYICWYKTSEVYHFWTFCPRKSVHEPSSKSVSLSELVQHSAWTLLCIIYSHADLFFEIPFLMSTAWRKRNLNHVSWWCDREPSCSSCSAHRGQNTFLSPRGSGQEKTGQA